MKGPSPHYWPAEWEAQECTWISWPHNESTWPNRFEEIPSTFYRFIATVSEVQTVHLLASSRDLATAFGSKVLELRNVEVHPIPTNDVWIRDYGPTFVTLTDDASLAGVCWKYNGWGGKYPPYDSDAQAAIRICQTLGCVRSLSAMHCEGGAIEGNGQGTMLTTSECLLNANRNPGWTKALVEAELRSQLAVEKVLWVDGGGLSGDDTDGHIDQLVRFTDPASVVAAVSNSSMDSDKDGLDANIRFLQQSETARGEKLTVVPLTVPPPRYIDGTRVPQSYCNFVLANGIVLLPTFRHESTDRAAEEILSGLFPSRCVIPFDAYDLAWGLGALHCASQQQPRAARPAGLSQ